MRRDGMPDHPLVPQPPEGHLGIGEDECHQAFSLDVNRSTSFEIRHSISKEEMTIRGPDKALNRFFANSEQQTGSWLKRRPGQKHVCT